MENKEQTNSDFNSQNILFFIYQWRKQLIRIGILAAVVSSVVALMIRDKYEATVVVFPATTNSISKSLLNDNYVKEDVLQFGEEEQAEQMLQILNSEAITGRIIQKYDLINHYEIGKNEKFQRTKLAEEFESNVSYKRTKFMSVEIKVLDWNADTAALIANDIAALYDSTKINIQRSRSAAALKIVEQEYFARLQEIKDVTDSIKAINELGLLDFKSQSENTTKQYTNAIAKGNTQAAKALQEKINIIAKYGSRYDGLKNKSKLLQKQLIIIKTKYEQAKVDAEQELPQKFIVSNAYPAEKKSYPVRWVIVVVSTLSSLLLAIIFILIFENYKQFKAQ